MRQNQQHQINTSVFVRRSICSCIVRSKSQWTEDGEKNSKYFLSLEKRNYEKKNIHLIKNQFGQIETNPKIVKSEIFKYYANLYSSNIHSLTSSNL